MLELCLNEKGIIALLNIPCHNINKTRIRLYDHQEGRWCSIPHDIIWHTTMLLSLKCPLTTTISL
jgi:hypothetical protein